MDQTSSNLFAMKLLNSVLYIAYDGLMEPLGQSQVWQYLAGLSVNHKIVLMSFEKNIDWENEAEKSRIKAEVNSKGVIWVPLHYHSKPSALATLFDIFMGVVVGLYLVMRHRIKIVYFWVRRYFVATIGFEEEKVRAYVRNQV